MTGTGPGLLAPPQATTYRVWHRTAYRYGMPVTDAYSIACLLPRDRRTQRVIESTVSTDPPTDEYDERRDVFGNHVVQIGVHRRHESFEIIAESVVETRPIPTPLTSASWEDVAATARAFRGADAIRIGPYRAPTSSSMPEARWDLLHEWRDRVFAPGRPLLDALRALSTAIFEEYEFDPAATDVATPLDTVLEHRRGVCQDFAHLAIAVCRSAGLPTAYISGYIETDPPPGQPRSIGADASHAWCAVWFPDHGWFDLDPTNDHVPPIRHVTVGRGRDYADVSPVRGVVIGPSGRQAMEVAVDVTRI